MSLKEKINVDYMSAFKSKNIVAKNLLSVVKGEIQTIEKNVGVDSLSDDDVVKILNKTVKSLKETQSKSPSAQTAEELFIIESYLPKQMTGEEILSKIEELISSGATSTGEIMRGFSGLPADRKMVSEIYLSKINKLENKIIN
jgi:uncharacterized protein YqeY